MSSSQEQLIRKLQQKCEKFQLESTKYQQENKILRDMWHMAENKSLGGTGNAVLMHRYEVLEDILNNEDKLHATTSLTKKEFTGVLENFDKERIKIEDAPLFRSDEKTKQDPGNRRSLYPRHALLMVLVRKKGNPTESMLGAFCGIDQSTVSRYLTFINKILEKILPTAKNVSKMIRGIKTVREFKKIVPGEGGGVIMADGTHTPVQRPLDSKERSTVYSGKKKRCTYNTIIFTNIDKIILGIGSTFEGRRHDLAMIKEDPLPFGIWGRLMKKKGVPDIKKIRMYTDQGYLGIKNTFHGIKSMQPHKKPPRGQLTKMQLVENRRINTIRIRIEHSIGMLKQYGMLIEPYDKGKEEFSGDLNIITGLVNLRLISRNKKYRYLLY